MRESVYIETTIVSYLAARRSRDLIQAAHQRLTREWWERDRPSFDVFASEFVLDEARRRDPRAARRRLALLEGVGMLDATSEVDRLVERMVRIGAVPERARADAYHVAVAAVHDVDFVLTWNCRHIANAHARGRIAAACASLGYLSPVLCTPEELRAE